MQSLLKWPDSPHLQHSLGCIEAAAWQSLWWEGLCQMGSDDLVVWGLIAGEVEAFQVIC